MENTQIALKSSLVAVQRALKAPKAQRNAFGKYNYRSCEDILEAVKPLLADQGLTLLITDTVKQVGDRYYVEATAVVTDGVSQYAVSAMAREEDSKKGMDAAQLTGATSSYARKYALNGMFCIDDTKDADATNDHGQAPVAQAAQKRAPKQSNAGDVVDRIRSLDEETKGLASIFIRDSKMADTIGDLKPNQLKAIADRWEGFEKKVRATKG